MLPTHLKGSQSPPAHTHAALLSAELSRMEPSPPSVQAFLGCAKTPLFQVQTDKEGIECIKSAVPWDWTQWAHFWALHISQVYVHTIHLLTFSIFLTTLLTARSSPALTTGSRNRRKTRRTSAGNMVSLQLWVDLSGRQNSFQFRQSRLCCYVVSEQLATSVRTSLNIMRQGVVDCGRWVLVTQCKPNSWPNQYHLEWLYPTVHPSATCVPSCTAYPSLELISYTSPKLSILQHMWMCLKD